MKQKKKQIFIISGVLLVLVALLGAAAWFMTRPEAGIENVTKDELNVEWYDENEKEFTITTADELFEFALLSSYYDFKGQTIKLGADIVVNEGDADEWGVTFPERVWDKPIDSFAGTFDGQGHTISGIYCMGYLYKCSGKGLKPLPAGLFSNTKPECVIKNFRLVNSYFEGDLQDGAGTISACGGGTFDSIYSDATLISYKYWNGGIIGKATESTTITNCWFDGDIQIIGGYARYTGGIMGRAMNKEADFLIEHCLATGTMYNETEKTGVGMGAILGNAVDSATVKINDCFVDADLTNEYKVAVGSVYGVSEQNAIVNLTNTYATTESYERMVGAVLGTANGMPVGYEREMLKGYGGYQWTSLDFEKYWSVVEDGTPILTTFADKTPSLEGVERYVDLSWYTDEATEYVLMDKADLYGFSLLTQSWDFKDKTVKLGADITVNEGKASAWAKEAPALEWISAGPKSKPFAGTFNGQMHTISGIYLDSDVMNTGLFSVTAEESTIKNLKLKNSYFKSEASFTGSIVGQGRGKIDTVYSDATVIASKGGIGGIVGLAYGTKGSVKNCWFAGTVTNTSNLTGERGTGGIIGTVYDEAGVKVENCLNTGTVDVRTYTFNQAKEGAAKNVTPIAGGIVGWVRKKTSSLDMKDCLNTGKVLVSNDVTGGYGSILGYSDGDTTIEHTYATTESSALTAAKIKGWVLAYEEAKLTGHEGYRWTTLNFDKYWSVMEKGTPVLKSFAGKGASTSGVARMVDTSWYDAKKDTYVLTDAADLYGFAYLSNGTDFAKKTIKLGADIIVNSGNAVDWASAAPALVWRPIASKNLPFAGTFDGQMHTISGIYVNANERNSGLFSATGETSVVKNLKIANSYLTSTAGELGSVAGQGRGTFDTVYSEAIVVGNSANTGGLVGMGYGKDVVMKKCWFNGSVTNTANHKNNRGTGGLIGTLYDGCRADIKGCLNSGVVDVTAYKFNQGTAKKPNVTPIAGGIVGWVKTAKSSVNIDNCLSTEGVLVDQTATGGYGAVVGYSENVKETAVTATYSTVSPLAGSKVQGKIYEVSAEDITGYKGYQWTVLDFAKYWAVVDASTPVVKPFASKAPAVAEDDRMIDVEWFYEAAGTKEDPYKLATKKDLYGFAMLSVDTEYEGFKDKTVVLVGDIEVNTGDISGWDEWTPIGSKDLPFAGTFDGRMHTISGVYLNADTTHNGLFGSTAATSTIQNLELANSHIETTGSFTGSIVGYGQGALDTIHVDETVTVVSSKGSVGGILGFAYGDKVSLKKSWFAGSVKNTSNVMGERGTGGLVGVVYDNTSVAIENCLNTGTVDVTAYQVNQGNATTKKVWPLAGGLVGWIKKQNTSVDIKYCLSTKAISVASVANGNYGSVVGYSDNLAGTKVYRTYSTVGTIGNAVTGNIFRVSERSVTGYLGYQMTLLDFENAWAVVLGGTPIIKDFAETVPSLANVEKMIDISWLEAGKGDSANNPYRLSDAADLNGFAALSQETANNGFANKYIALDEDIVVNTGIASEWDENAPKYEWMPIGTFKGHFSGEDPDTKEIHTISGIYQPATFDRRNGLFSVTAAGSSVKNIKLKNSYFNTSHNSLGSVVGYAQGTFDTIYSNAIVVSSNVYAGGLFGMCGSSTINKCWFDGKVENTNSGVTQTGGIMGIAYSANVNMNDCLNSGIVDVANSTKKEPKAGGFVGDVYRSNLTLTDCLTVGSIKTGASSYGGMFAGCFDASKVISNTSYATGYARLVGLIQNNSTFKINYVLNGGAGSADRGNAQNYTAVGNVPVVTSARTFIDTAAGTSLEGFDFTNNWSTVKDNTPVLKVFEKESYDISWYDASKTTYTLYDRGDLYGLAVLSQDNNFNNKVIELGADIIVNVGEADDWETIVPNFKWLPIGDSNTAFAGEFDGKNHTISGIYCNRSAQYTGLFGFVNSNKEDTIRNLKLINSYIASNAMRTGGLVGRVDAAQFNTVYCDAYVSSSAKWVGGFVGMAYNAAITMNNCQFAGTVTNTGNGSGIQGTGGFIGDANSACNITMNDCLNTGTVDATAYKYVKSGNVTPCAGGLIGYVEGNANASINIKNCLVAKEVLVDASANIGYGPAVGFRSGGAVSITNVTYVMAEEYDGAISQLTVNLTNLRRENNVNALNGKSVVEDYGFEANNLWVVVPNGTPRLESFKNMN